MDNLLNQIKKSRTEIVTDSYEMSWGEVINLYQEGDLVISPAYQRLFRWDDGQKTSFIESILLWFPTPSIFVFQGEDGRWELIDGLQRVSTVLQLLGVLVGENSELVDPLVLYKTDKLPSLDQKTWETLEPELKRDIKRSRLRIEILKSTSDHLARYELFQRLNTGGSELSEQEVRNCILTMLNPDLASWLKNLGSQELFLKLINQTEAAIKKEFATELVLRFFAYMNRAYDKGTDVHSYLNTYAREVATDSSFILKEQGDKFIQVLELIDGAHGADSFKRRDAAGRYLGQFLLTKYEVITYGIAVNLAEILQQKSPSDFIRTVLDTIDSNDVYKNNSGSGVRASSRLSNLLTLGREIFKP